MSSEEPDPAGLQVHELVVRTEGRTVIDGVSLAVREGDRLAVMGPSGVGKSTLLRAIAGLIDVDAGTVTLDGRTPDQVGFPRWRRQVTYVAQAPAQLGMSARRWLDALASLGSQSAGVLGAVDIAREWGVEPALWDRPFGRLSGGERQRIAIAEVQLRTLWYLRHLHVRQT